MKQDNLGRCILNEHDALELLYNGKLIDNTNIELSVINQYNNAVEQGEIDLNKLKNIVDIDMETFDQQNQNNWYMPDEYKQLDIVEWLNNHELTQKQRERLHIELEMFRERGMIPVLKFMKYLVDTMRKNNIVWGVGRGSSVSSYVLYLIGVHKVDSIKFNLDIGEFLR